MKYSPEHKAPADAEMRKAAKPVICYPPETLPKVNMEKLKQARQQMEKVDSIIVPPRDARCFEVKRGHFFRIVSVEGPQVGDFNLWNSHCLDERFYSGKTRALYGTHVSVGDQMWSSFPYMRAMTTITHDTLDWYGFDADGASVHDIIGTRCDPYTHMALSGETYHHCCHSNLTRALGEFIGDIKKAEPLVHDVMNVFMCTGFTKDTHQYFMKASPVRCGDYLEFFAEMDLIGGLSACPGGDCGSEHSSDTAPCYPLLVEIYRPDPSLFSDWKWNEENAYDRSHGVVR